MLIILMIILGKDLYSQSYYFKQKDESIQYKNSQGGFSTKLEKSTVGKFEMKFEIGSSNGKEYPLFTEYNNGKDMGWYGLLEQKTSQEVKGKIYEGFTYYSTVRNVTVTVFFSRDKSSLIIFSNDDIIEYK